MTKIDFRWPRGKIAAIYRLAKADGIWKIDGISCAGASALPMH
jgi:hypothetical protein